MDYLTVSNVHGHMIDPASPFIEQQISGFDAADGDGASIVCLGIGCSADVITKMTEHLLSKSGTVRAVCQAVSAVAVLIPHKLQSIIYNLPAGSS